MGKSVMNAVLRVAGAILLIVACGGAGLAVSAHQMVCWRQLHTLARLFQYLQGLLSYQALTAKELLQRAAYYPEFAVLFKNECNSLDQLSLPAFLSTELHTEILSGLRQLAWEPRQNACATLERLAALCEEAAVRKHEEAQTARNLWPRLGFCAGILAVVLLW